MNESSSKDLLGYMLGALDPQEHEDIDQRIEQRPELKEELQDLKDQIAPLDDLSPPGLPPAGLARRTCEYIATLPARPVTEEIPVEKANRHWFSPRREPRESGRRSIMDFVIVASVLMLLAAIVLPAINHSRFESRKLACQENLREVGFGLLEYANQSGGQHIEIPKAGNLSVAGYYAPKLIDAGLITDHSKFLCAGLGSFPDHQIPTLAEMATGSGDQLQAMQQLAGGDFAYSLGHQTDGDYDSGINQHRQNFILLADKPKPSNPGRASDNHGGYGQNAFFEDGHIQFLDSPVIGEDAIYENNWGQVGPGAHENDIVVAPSATSLSLFTRYD